MKQHVKPAEIAPFLNRFYNFCDTVIESIQLAFSDNATRELKIILKTRDAECIKNEGWTRAVLCLNDVSELKLIDHRKQASLQVISHGIYVLDLNENLGLEFGGGITEPESLEEPRSSHAYAIGGTMAFETLE